MRGTVRQIGMLAALWMVAGPSTGRAQTAVPQVGNEPSVAVIEVYLKDTNGVASADYSRSIASGLGSTGQYAVMERDEVAARFRTVLTTPLKRLQMERLESIERLVREGDQLVYTDPKAAVDVLTRARSELETIAEGLAANESLRKEFLRTHMLLARSHLDTGNEVKAAETLRDVIRLQGDAMEVTERDYHPRLVALYRKVQKAMNEEMKGTLTVETEKPGCETLLDGRVLATKTPAEYRNLYPGIHRVQLRCGDKESMIRKVVLIEGQPVHLSVDVAFEHALTVENGRLGLVFETVPEATAHVVSYAAKFGSLVNADLVAVHGFTDPGSRADLKGWLVDVKRVAEIKNASVPAKTDVVTPSSVKALVQKLTGSERVVVRSEVAQSGGTGKRWYKNWGAWTVGGLGVAGLVVGGVFTGSYLTHKDHATDPDYTGNPYDEADKAYQARRYMWVGYGVGAAAIAGSIVWFVLSDRPAKSAEAQSGTRFAAMPTVLPGGAGLSAAMTF